MSKKTKAARKPKDAQERLIAQLEKKLASAQRERRAKLMEENGKLAALTEETRKALMGVNSAVHEAEEALRAAKASQRAETAAEASQTGRLGATPYRAAHDALASVPGAVDTDGVGKVVKAPTVIQVQDTLSRSRLITGGELSIAREFQALFRQCSFGDIRAANMERIGVGSKPGVIDFVEDKRSEMNRLFRLMGGMSSPMGSILYHVVGMEESLRAWCQRQASDGKRQWTPDNATGLLAAAIAHLHVIWSFRHIVVIEDAVRGQLLKVGRREGAPA